MFISTRLAISRLLPGLMETKGAIAKSRTVGWSVHPLFSFPETTFMYLGDGPLSFQRVFFGQGWPNSHCVPGPGSYRNASLRHELYTSQCPRCSGSAQLFSHARPFHMGYQVQSQVWIRLGLRENSGSHHQNWIKTIGIGFGSRLLRITLDVISPSGQTS